MAAQTLAELEVLFKQAGAADLDKSFALIHAKLEDLDKGARQVGQTMQTAMGFGIAMAVDRLRGFAMAGLQASSMGTVLNFQMAELSRQIGSLFVPEIQKASELLGDLVRWFQNLTGEQQRSIAHWIEFGGILVAASTILPRIVGMFNGLAGAVELVSTAFQGLSLTPLGLVAAGLVGLITVTGNWGNVLKSVGESFAKLAEPMKRLWESLSKVFERLATALAPIIDSLLSGFGKLMTVLSRILEFIAKVIDKVSDLVGKAVEGFSKLDDKVAGGKAKQISELMAEIAPDLFFGGSAATIVGNRLEEQNKKDQEKKDRTELPRAAGGFTSLNAAWERIAESSLKATGGAKKTDEETLEFVKNIYNFIKDRAAKMVEPVRE